MCLAALELFTLRFSSASKLVVGRECARLSAYADFFFGR